MSYQFDAPGWLEAFNAYFLVFSSVIYVILRMTEPIVFAAFKQSATDLFCCKRSPSYETNSMTESHSSARTDDSSSSANTPISHDSIKTLADRDELTDSLSAFLTSSLNVELVYTILKGIMKIAKMNDQ